MLILADRLIDLVLTGEGELLSLAAIILAGFISVVVLILFISFLWPGISSIISKYKVEINGITEGNSPPMVDISEFVDNRKILEADEPVEKIDIYQSAVNELTTLRDIQLQASQDINSRAMDVLRINQIIIVAIVIVFTLFAEFQVSFFPIAALILFITSIIFCSSVCYLNDVIEVDISIERVDKVSTREEYYKNIMNSYSKLLSRNNDVIGQKNRRLQWGIWSSVVGVLFFVISVLFVVT